MEVVLLQVAKPVAGFFVGQIGQGLSQIRQYKRNIEHLFDLRNSLEDTRREIEARTDDAGNKLQDIVPEIRKWLAAVNNILEEEEWAFLQGDEWTDSMDDTIRKSDRWCFGLLPMNLKYRYDISKKAEETSKLIEEKLAEIKARGSSDVGLPSKTPELGSTPSEFSKSLVSRVLILERILEALKDKEVNMIGVYGMGGVGKTTLVDEVARRAEADESFSAVVTAEISQIPDIITIQQRIADRIDLPLKVHSSVEERALKLYKRLKQLSLNGRKKQYHKVGDYVLKRLKTNGKKQHDDQGAPEKEMKLLVILDDVWKKLDLQRVGIPYGQKKEEVYCKIVFTTRSEHICDEMGVHKKFKVADLDSTEARALLLEKAEHVPTDQEGSKLVIDELATKCGGLPLAIAVLADKLRNRDLSVWKRVAAELGKPVFARDGVMEEKVYPILEMSYNFIGSNEKKKFFMLCCLFPSGSSISIQDLIRYGAGLGLFRYMNSLAEATQQACSWATELKSSSLLLEAEDEGHVRIHDVVRIASLYIAAKGEHVFQVGSFPRLLTEETYETYTAISMMPDDKLQPLSQFEFPKLEMLLLRATFPSGFDHNFKQRMKNLKVLVMSNMTLLTLPSSITSLKKLRTLHLEHCELEDVSIICELTNLSCLSLRQSMIEEIPKKFGELRNLMLLDLTGCSSLQIITNGVLANLTELEEFYVYQSFEDWDTTSEGQHDQEDMTSLIELASLSNLNVLEMHIPSIHHLPEDLIFPDCSSFKISIGFKKYLEESEQGSHSRILLLGYMDTDNKPPEGGLSGLLMQTECLILRQFESLKSVYDLGEEGFSNLKSVYIEGWYGAEYIVNIDDGAHFKSDFFVNLFMTELKAIRHVPPLYYDFLNGLKESHLLHMIDFQSFWDDTKTNQCFFDEKMEFPLLEDLTIDGVAGIEELWHFPGVEKEPAALAALARLSLNSLPNLTLIWRKDTPHSVGRSFRNLRTLEVCYCPSLMSLCPLSVAAILEQLDSLEIHWNKTMEAVVVEETGHAEINSTTEMIVFPKLRFLILTNLFCLRCFFQGSFKLVFPSLERIVCIGNNKVIAFAISELPIEEEENDGSLPRYALFDEKVSLPAIKLIEIKSESLQRVWGNHLPTESFGKLETFQIYGAHKETTILPIAAAQSMKNLEELFVGSFDSAEKFSESEVPPSDGSSSELLLPQLRKLEIDTLPKLMCMPWRVLYIKNLRFLSISGVNNLKYLFPVSTISRFKQLEKLDIKNCAAMEAIIGGDEGASNTTQGTFTFPQLNSLQLEDLQQLVSFSSENLVLEFPRLEVMKFTRCPLAQKVDVFRSMQHVKELTVIECDLPEELYIVKARDGHGFLPQMNKLTLGGLPHLRSVSWAVLPVRNLHFLSISGTKGLKFLFSTAICKEFVELEEISMIQCEDLEVVVSYEEKDGDAAPVKIALPRLRIIELSDLPRLGCFSSGKYAFEFPSLEVVKIDGCPIMERFSFASLSTPKLRSMEIGGEEEDTDSGLNETIHNLFNKEVCSRLDEHLREKELESIDEVWHSPPAGEESAAAIFLKLTDLTLESLPNLKHVWRKEVDGDNHRFGYLVELSICYCHSLESLCPLSIAAALVQLKYLKIYGNRNLKEIIAKQTEETNGTQIIIFPKLETLELRRLTSLLYFFRGNLKLVLPSLEKIYSVHNHEMITFVNTENSAMEESETDNRGITKHRVNSSPHKHALFDDKVALPAMKEITIQQEGLEEVWSSDDLAVGSFVQVKILRMFFALKVTRVVSFRALQRMQNLKELEAVGFDSAEEFFELDDKIGGRSSPILAQLRSLKLQRLPLLNRIPWKELDIQNLRSLNIATANKLKSLFSVSICKAFVLLEEIYVWSCENMEEIVAEEPEVDATSVEGAIVFPRIKTIELGDLPKLRSFCSLENKIEFPSLKSMELKGCRLMEKFSTGLLNTPKLTTVSIEDEDVRIIYDLNETLYSQLQNKEQSTEEERSNGAQLT